MSFDPFSCRQNGWPASDTAVGQGEIVDALVAAVVVAVVDKGGEWGLELTGWK
jgi:hypothetical protein